jgi:hypothetical protein
MSMGIFQVANEILFARCVCIHGRENETDSTGQKVCKQSMVLYRNIIQSEIGQAQQNNLDL